jgi:hypothetical protein
MPPPTLQSHSELPDTKVDPIQSVVSAESGLKSSSSPLPPEPVPAARQVLSTILKVIDQPERIEQAKVDLQFSFGKDTLEVRVGMQAGQVHTTFQSSSPELRAALASQWQGFTEQVTDATRTLLEPVFKETPSPTLGSSGQQDSSGQQSASRHRETPFDRHAGNPDREENEEGHPSPSQPASSPGSQQLLNTLA